MRRVEDKVGEEGEVRLVWRGGGRGVSYPESVARGHPTVELGVQCSEEVVSEQDRGSDEGVSLWGEVNLHRYTYGLMAAYSEYVLVLGGWLGRGVYWGQLCELAGEVARVSLV